MKSRTEASAEEMMDHLRSLVSEAEQVMHNGVSSTPQVIADLKERLEVGLEKLNEIYGDARERVAAGARRTDETIREHPYESIAIALGVGLLVGYLIKRR